MPSGIYKRKPHTERTKEKIRLGNLGVRRSEATKEKMKQAALNKPPVTKATKEKIRQGNLGKKRSKETREKMSKARIGMKFSEEHKRKIGKANKGHIGWAKGKKFSKEHKKNLKKNSYIKGKFGKNHPTWKGGCQKNERNDPAYHQWVKAVKKRDNNTCWINDENCKGYNIVHHIFPWRKYPKLRYKLKNGITLCQRHHPRGRAKEELFRKLFSYLVIQR